MMDWTDRHCRVLHRTLSSRALLYTEMLTSGAVLHGDRDWLLGYDPAEHPVALQLGGSDPKDLAAAARIGADLGYDEINLNVGCPSDRVQSGRFGACLMREPELVAECMAAIGAAVSVPATVKCRIGVDDQDPKESLFRLVELSAQAGVKRVDEIEFFGRAEGGSAQAALTQHRNALRARLASATGLTGILRELAARASTGGASGVEVY